MRDQQGAREQLDRQDGQDQRAYSEWTRYLASRSIRDQRHKLIHWFTGGLALARPAPRRVSWVELYDLLEDPDETHDLAAERPDVTRELEGQLRDWVGGQLQPGEVDPLLRPELACWEPGGRATVPSGQRTGGALSPGPQPLALAPSGTAEARLASPEPTSGAAPPPPALPLPRGVVRRGAGGEPPAAERKPPPGRGFGAPPEGRSAQGG